MKKLSKESRMYFLNWQNKSVKFVNYNFFKKLTCFDKIEEKWTDY